MVLKELIFNIFILWKGVMVMKDVILNSLFLVSILTVLYFGRV